MIDQVIDRWHAYMRGDLPGGLDELLADDVVFYSPVVFTPQVGKAITSMYLEAAASAFPGDAGDEGGTPGDQMASDESSGGTGAFRYTKKILSGDTAVLEFETTMEGKYVNGIDMIQCDDQGKIIEFRVMIRPLQAVQAVHRSMQATLERMQQLG